LKIYIASSWKNEKECKEIARGLRDDGHEVDCFCDESGGRFVFHWSELVKSEEDLKNFNAISFLADERTQKAFKEDKKWLDWADTVLLVLPAGNSAHLEAGYKKGQGGKLFIYGPFPKGQFDVMYGFADGLFSWADLELMRVTLLECSEKLEIERKAGRKN
jgi:hypothetical protein